MRVMDINKDTLFHADGNYLWNSNTDSIFGKRVIISEFMPSAELGKGGTVSFNSKEGAGTTFVVELPIPFSSNAAKTPSQARDAVLQKYDFSNVHILMCEDHPINQKVATRILEKAGAKITAAEDGKIGLDTFINSPDDAFNLILMDIRMPNMDGYEAAEAIRASNHPRAKTIPIIAMTANAFSEDVQKSLAAGMNEHLAKPITPEQLYKVVRLYTGTDYLSHKREKILFVDDVELNIEVLTAAIQNEYDTIIARNGEEALVSLEANPDISAVITDIMMPGIDGITLIKTIRANDKYKRIAVIANTQYGDKKQEEDLRALGADDFLYKPTTPELVRLRPKYALAKYR